MSGKQKAYRLVLCCCVISLFMTVFTSCSVLQKRTRRGSAIQTSPTMDTQTITGIVIQNDVDIKQLQIQELDSDVVSILNYGAVSVFTDKYKEEREAEWIEPGMILQAVYRTADDKLVSAEVPKDVWEYQDVRRFSFTGDESMMQFAGHKYQYSSMTFFASGNDTIELMELNDQDVITVRGIGIHVYSVVRTSGHGYIRLANYQDFVGGMAEISNSIIVPISENMLVTVAEGAYHVTLCKRGASATKTVTVRSDEEVVADFRDCEIKSAENIGEVTFEIEPEGASLYLNGTAVNYSKPIVLRYGKYNITVALTGYKTYSGVLEVAQPISPPLHIDLVGEKAAVTSSPKTTPKASADNSDVVTKKIDSNHTITVSAPRGVEVYLDNVFKGMAPCSFTKVIGSQTITLSRTGYVTKSYSVDILDDNENAEFTFADLAEDKND